MKVLIVNTSESYGGAAIAARRLCKALRAGGVVDAQMLVQKKNSCNSHIYCHSNKISANLYHHLDYLPARIYRNRIRTTYSTALVGKNIAKYIAALKPDIVHLHWVNGGFFPFSQLAHISQPIVWTLHDMWPFTGGCHYTNGCSGYMQQCGQCPFLGSSSATDISHLQHLRKSRTLNKLHKPLTVVGLSSWLAQCAGQSSLLSQFRIENLPNCINTQTFSPATNTQQLRQKYGIQPNAKVVAFGAMGGTADPRKGFDLLLQSLAQLPHNQNNIHLLVFGHEPKTNNLPTCTTTYTGHINTEAQMAEIYSVADAMVVPSREENLSNVVMESLACGTPVVAFNIGGMPDMIQHKHNGYLAAPFLTDDLAKGITWVIENQERTKELATNARTKVVTQFSEEVVTANYIRLYEEIQLANQTSV